MNIVFYQCSKIFYLVIFNNRSACNVRVQIIFIEIDFFQGVYIKEESEMILLLWTLIVLYYRIEPQFFKKNSKSMGYKLKHLKNEKHFFNTGITSYGCKEISTENPFSCVYHCGFNLVNKGCQIILFIFHENCHLAFRIILLVSTKKNFPFVQNMLILVDVKQMNNECCQLICHMSG